MHCLIDLTSWKNFIGKKLKKIKTKPKKKNFAEIFQFRLAPY